MIAFLKQQKELLVSMVLCLQNEKEALIKEDAKNLISLIEEKKQLIILLDGLEEKRNNIYPNVTIRDLEEKGLLEGELGDVYKEVIKRIDEVQELQETNKLLTLQSLEYTNQMIYLLRGNKKPAPASYGAHGKIEKGKDQGNSMLDRSI